MSGKVWPLHISTENVYFDQERAPQHEPGIMKILELEQTCRQLQEENITLRQQLQQTLQAAELTAHVVPI